KEADIRTARGIPPGTALPSSRITIARHAATTNGARRFATPSRLNGAGGRARCKGMATAILGSAPAGPRDATDVAQRRWKLGRERGSLSLVDCPIRWTCEERPLPFYNQAFHVGRTVPATVISRFMPSDW